MADDVGAAVLTLPASIAWLLNIRGGDVPHTPLPLCFAILPAKGKPELFIASKKLSPSVRKALVKDVTLRAPEALSASLAALGKGGAKVQLDPERAAQWFADQLEEAGAEISLESDPCIALKAKKNKVEIAGTRTAHKRDGVAMCRFLAWLDEWVLGVPDHAAYRVKLGPRLDDLRIVGSAPAAPADYAAA